MNSETGLEGNEYHLTNMNKIVYEFTLGDGRRVSIRGWQGTSTNLAIYISGDPARYLADTSLERED